MKVDRNLLEQLSSIIYAKAGLFLQRRDLDKLKSFIEKQISAGRFKSPQDVLREATRSRSFLNELLDVVTINETYFFRHKSHFDVLQNKILPEFFSQRGKVKLWSAGCSTGEEPYTLAIVAKEVQKSLGRGMVQVVANDVSQEAIAKAKEGVYNQYSIRFVPPDILDRYFEKLPDGRYRVKDEVRSLVQFMLLSITSETDMARIRNMVDVAMCRNVLIYFDENSRKKALQLIADNLRIGGYLFLGPAESARGVVKNLKMVLFPGAVAYRKESA